MDMADIPNDLSLGIVVATSPFTFKENSKWLTTLTARRRRHSLLSGRLLSSPLSQLAAVMGSAWPLLAHLQTFKW